MMELWINAIMYVLALAVTTIESLGYSSLAFWKSIDMIRSIVGISG